MREGLDTVSLSMVAVKVVDLARLKKVCVQGRFVAMGLSVMRGARFVTGKQISNERSSVFRYRLHCHTRLGAVHKRAH